MTEPSPEHPSQEPAENAPDTPASEKKRPRGIYLLPNLFTTGCLFAGFYAIVASMNGRFEAAAIAIFIAMIMDGLDGRVARMTNTQSEFGAEYDSLADMVSFGLAPSLVMFQWALSDLGKLGWLAAFVYTAGTALRLARFNTQVGIADKRYFQGLPSPAAAAVITGLVWVGHDYQVEGQSIAVLALLLTVTIGVLMVSNVRYNSFKGTRPQGQGALCFHPGGGAGIRTGFHRPAASVVCGVLPLCHLWPGGHADLFAPTPCRAPGAEFTGFASRRIGAPA